MVTPDGEGVGELWYSLLHLDLRNAHARDALGDTQAMHKLIQQGFPGRRQAHNILYQRQPDRLGYAPQVLVQSTDRPGWGTLNTALLTVDVKDITTQWRSLKPGASYLFRVTANPTVTVNGTRRRRALIDPPSQTLWIIRRFAPAATISQLYLTDPRTHTGKREDAIVAHSTITFSGVLTVADADHLRHVLAAGIGPGKAYGCGLLTLAPCRRIGSNAELMPEPSIAASKAPSRLR